MNDLSARVEFTIDTDAPVDDAWLQALQQHIATHLPVEIGWAGVHRFSMQVKSDREVDPDPPNA
jgi:hypothetical protein